MFKRIAVVLVTTAGVAVGCSAGAGDTTTTAATTAPAVVLLQDGETQDVSPPTRLDVVVDGDREVALEECNDMGGTLRWAPVIDWSICEGVDY